MHRDRSVSRYIRLNYCSACERLITAEVAVASSDATVNLYLPRTFASLSAHGDEHLPTLFSHESAPGDYVCWIPDQSFMHRQAFLEGVDHADRCFEAYY